MSYGVLSYILNLKNGLRNTAKVASVMLALGSLSAQAADITWGGLYRVEGVKIENPELSSQNTDTSYALQHLVLLPKIVAADGVTIFGRLDVLNNPAYGINANGQINSLAGDFFGDGPGTTKANGGPARGTDSNSWGRTEAAGLINVTSLYATWSQEFGQLIVGRVPMQFGLGTAFSAGNGLFDHYIDTRDLIGYKIVFGNLYVLPMRAKFSQGALNTMNDVDDYMVQLQYENPESELSLGVLYDIRVVTGNDAPLNGYLGGTGATNTGSYKNTLTALYFSEKAGSSARVSVEADLLSGDTGVQTGPAQTPPLAGVGLNAFGIAAEVAWLPPADTKWGGNFKLGLATGDDPGTNDVYEGYAFNRNYQVATLLFHHPLGQRDFLRTGMVRDTTTPASNQIDSEAISNALYFAPSISYRSSDKLSYGASLIYARLNKDPIGPNSGTGMSLGYETDFSVTYKPMERLTWLTQLGALLPGDAWQGGNLGLEHRMAYGIETKAAISF